MIGVFTLQAMRTNVVFNLHGAGFRLRDPKDIMVVQRWKKVASANMVTLYDAFTTTRFQDSCLSLIDQDYEYSC